MDKTFICVAFDGHEAFINIYQIVAAILVDDELQIALSDGSTFIATGEAMEKVVNMLAEIAMNLDGESVIDMAARMRAKESKLTLIKGGEKKSVEKSEKSTPQSEE